MNLTKRLYPRRNLEGIFAPAVRPDGWQDSDLAGQASAAELARHGAAGIYVNTFGVAYGRINGVEVIVSRTSPTRPTHDGAVLILRRHWTPQHGNFVKVHGGTSFAAPVVLHHEVAGSVGGNDYSSECSCGDFFSAPTSDLLAEITDAHYRRAA